MADYRTTTKEFQDEFLNLVSKSQTAVVDAIQTWASAVQAITPDLPGVNLPYAEKLPRPDEFVASGYDFAEQLLASQRKFTEDVLQATMWALPTGEDTPAKPAAAAPVRKTSTEAK
jgi:hypothetical protein